MKYVAVFCSASQLEEKYSNPSRTFARLLGKNGYNLVWGGSDTGLMSVIANEVRKAGGKLIGVTMDIIKDAAFVGADEMIVLPDLTSRKETMLKRADAFVVLVGGIGTLDELTHILELKKHNVHTKPMVVLNTENFYEGLKVQLQKMKDDGFIKTPLDDYIYFADTPSEAIEYINGSLR